jgi:hypothetical protein
LPYLDTRLNNLLVSGTQSHQQTQKSLKASSGNLYPSVKPFPFPWKFKLRLTSASKASHPSGEKMLPWCSVFYCKFILVWNAVLPFEQHWTPFFQFIKLKTPHVFCYKICPSARFVNAAN